MRSVFIIAPLLFAASHADTIELKDGTVLQGEVLSSDEESHLVRVNVTETIRDERRIPKEDVARIVEERQDIAAFEALKSLLPTPDLLEPADYARRIKQLEDFIEEHPDSPRKSDATEMIDKLEAEKSQVEAGGIKFEGEMISPEERRAKAFPLDSQIAASKVERLAEAGDLTAALRAWDELQQNFATSRAYVETVPLALDIMRSHARAITSSLADIDQRKEERMKGLERVPANDRDRVIRALKDESAAYLRLVASEEQSGVRWISLNPFFSVQLNQVLTLLRTEIANLENFDPTSIPDGDKAWNEAWEVIHDEDPETEPSQALAAARSALPDKYFAILEQEAAKQQVDEQDE